MTSLPPTILTIFGATGDLSSDYLLPALLHMQEQKLLPEDFRLVAVGRRDLDAKSYLDFILKKSTVLGKIKPGVKKEFLKHLLYFKGDFDKPESFLPLAKILGDQEKPKHQCYNRLYYFATSPQYFASVTKILKQAGLLMACGSHQRKVRVLVEKPFGFNYKSANALNKLLLKYFSEDQIYRIDHYLGKETVQNLMVVRFANSIFEPLWSAKNIDHIQLNVLYNDKVGSRADYFDQAGSIKDVVQNHVLQMLALTVMDEPKDLTAQNIRDEKVKVLKSLQPFNAKAIAENVVRGQYVGYEGEIGKSSNTETFVALKASLNSPRWKGVPIYLRTGMTLGEKVTEISIHFKEPLRCIFKGCSANILTFRIQPDESVHLQINNKVPGFGVELHQGDLEFGYHKAFSGKIPPAYERLLLDFMEGDQRLFIRSDEIEAAWKFIDSITENPAFKKLPLYKYKPGSRGPEASQEWIKKDQRLWWTE